MLQILKNPYVLMAFLYDLIIIGASFLLSWSLRFEIFNPFAIPIENLQVVFFLSVSVQVACLYYSDFYKGGDGNLASCPT